MPRQPRPCFEGFDRRLARYLADLAAHNRRDWFEDHREEYDTLALEPARAFVSALAPGLARRWPRVVADPRVGRSILRIHRDARFSKGREPYKTSLHFRFAEAKGRPAFFVRIGSADVGIAAGVLRFESGPLARYRAAAADEGTGMRLVRAAARVEKRGYTFAPPHYKRIPRGFEPDPTRAPWLLYRGLFASARWPHPPELFSAESTSWVLARFRELSPVFDWLDAHVGPDGA